MRGTVPIKILHFGLWQSKSILAEVSLAQNITIAIVKHKDLYGGNNYCFCSLERFGRKKKQIVLQCIHVSVVNQKNVVIMKRVSLECSVALKSFEYTFKTFPVCVIQ